MRIGQGCLNAKIAQQASLLWSNPVFVFHVLQASSQNMKDNLFVISVWMDTEQTKREQIVLFVKLDRIAMKIILSASVVKQALILINLVLLVTLLVFPAPRVLPAQEMAVLHVKIARMVFMLLQRVVWSAVLVQMGHSIQDNSRWNASLVQLALLPMAQACRNAMSVQII